MIKKPIVSDISSKKMIVVFKHSRLSYALEKGSPKEQESLSDKNDPITRELTIAHEKNLQSIEEIKSILDDLRISYSMICRSEMNSADLKNKLVVCVGGDGTLLDTSHYCWDSPILGVNSDPESSIGALCAANSLTFREVIKDIYAGRLLPSRTTRLSLTVGGKKSDLLVLNDILFCHKNPASMSRFFLSLNKKTESHRSSGIWVATAAGSTGGIYSCGADSLPIDQDRAIFRLREPYWTDTKKPELLQGSFSKNDLLTIRSNMTDGQIFIDGPHKTIDIELGETVEIGLADQPLWLFDGPRLNANREKIIEQRKSIRSLLRSD